MEAHNIFIDDSASARTGDMNPELEAIYNQEKGIDISKTLLTAKGPSMTLRLVKRFKGRRGAVEFWIGDNYRIQRIDGWSKDHAHRRIAWLAITRSSDAVLLHDWRDLQEIKTLICGPETEAVEIYPPESELLDANNNFHLWVYLDGYRLPFGFRGQRVVADERLNNEKCTTRTAQRNWTVMPVDAVGSLSAATKIRAAPIPPLASDDDVAAMKVKEKRKAKRKRSR